MILAGRERTLYLGNLDARRDWGFAGDYVEAMWRILQADRPDDFVIATGASHPVREWLRLCCDLTGLDPERIVVIDRRYFRPTEVDALEGDPSKAERLLGWKAQVGFERLAAMMLAADLADFGLDPRRYPKLLERLAR
jgi:GDPmannose 4,6-dehydratase